MNSHVRRLPVRLASTFGIAVTLIQTVGSASAAIIIDDFSVGPIVVSRAEQPPVIELQTDLPTAHVLGGSRLITLGVDGSPTQIATVEADASRMRLTNNSYANGFFYLTYGSDEHPLNLDLSDSVDLDFTVRLRSAGPLVPPNRLWLYGEDDVEYQAAINAYPLGGDGKLIKIPVQDFENWMDLSAIRKIQLEFFTFSSLINGDVLLDHFAIVPEPGAMTLMGLSAIAILRSRRDVSSTRGG